MTLRCWTKSERRNPDLSALTPLLAANLGTSQATAPQRSFQLFLGDWLLSQYAFEEPFQGFHSGRELLHLCGDGSQLWITHAFVYRSFAS